MAYGGDRPTRADDLGAVSKLRMNLRSTGTLAGAKCR
jgi:hypothetical protein